MIEILRTILNPFLWIQKVIEFFSDAIDNILGKGVGILIVYVGYLIVFIILGFLTLKFIKKKKYWASAPLFIILLLMFLYTIVNLFNIANKGF
ncbi:MAG: hypothetical protein V1773_06670 [bacterium]